MNPIIPKPFFVGQRTFDSLQDAVNAAAADSIKFKRACITQTLTPGIYGYAGTAVVVAQFEDGLDLLAKAADEDGHPDEDARAQALKSTNCKVIQAALIQ